MHRAARSNRDRALLVKLADGSSARGAARPCRRLRSSPSTPPLERQRRVTRAPRRPACPAADAGARAGLRAVEVCRACRSSPRRSPARRDSLAALALAPRPPAHRRSPPTPPPSPSEPATAADARVYRAPSCARPRRRPFPDWGDVFGWRAHGSRRRRSTVAPRRPRSSTSTWVTGSPTRSLPGDPRRPARRLRIVHRDGLQIALLPPTAMLDIAVFIVRAGPASSPAKSSIA